MQIGFDIRAPELMVAPYRPAVLTAKIISTIDILSGGRITVGVVTGWMKDEFEAVGAPDFSKRGRVPDDQKVPQDTLSRLRGGMARLRGLTEAAGRDPASVSIAIRVHDYGERLAPQANDGERQLFSGSPTEIAADLERIRELGICAVDFRFSANTTTEAMHDMETFRHDVIARVK